MMKSPGLVIVYHQFRLPMIVIGLGNCCDLDTPSDVSEGEFISALAQFDISLVLREGACLLSAGEEQFEQEFTG